MKEKLVNLKGFLESHLDSLEKTNANDIFTDVALGKLFSNKLLAVLNKYIDYDVASKDYFPLIKVIVESLFEGMKYLSNLSENDGELAKLELSVYAAKALIKLNWEECNSTDALRLFKSAAGIDENTKLTKEELEDLKGKLDEFFKELKENNPEDAEVVDGVVDTSNFYISDLEE